MEGKTNLIKFYMTFYDANRIVHKKFEAYCIQYTPKTNDFFSNVKVYFPLSF